MEPIPDADRLQDLAIHRAPDLLVVVDPELRAVWANGAVTRVLGHPEGAMVGTPIADHVHPDDLDHAVGALGEAHRTDGYHIATRLRLRRADRTYVDTRVTAMTHTDEAGTWMVLAVRLVEDEVAIERRRVQLKALAQSVYVTCAALHWYEADEWVDSLLGGLGAVVGARSVELADADGAGGPMILRAAWNQPGAGGRELPVGSAFAPVAGLASIRSSACVLTHLDAGDVLHHRHGGTGVVAEIGLEPQDRRSQAVGVVRLGFDGVSPDWDDANADIVALMCSTLLATIQRCAEERRVNEESKLDPLTRLLNRSALLEQLTGMMDGDGPGRPVVLFADLNAFKQLNDTYGHREGDVVLRTVAQAIVAEVRDGDLAARIGGDEFVIVFDAPMETAGALVARIRGAVDRAIAPWKGVSVAVGAIAVGPNGTADDVLERADLAMYKDKRSTRERAERAADGPPPAGHSGLIRSPIGRQERS